MTTRVAGLVAMLLGAGDSVAQGQQRDTQPVSLPPAAATAKAPTTEFERRMVEGKGQFISREELEKSQAKRMADVLQRLRGIRLYRSPRGEAFAINSRGQVTMLGSNPTCYVQVYLDDVPLPSTSSHPPSKVPSGMVFNLNSLSPSEIEGVEYYVGLGEIPPKYNRTGSVCGVLLLWTRAR